MWSKLEIVFDFFRDLFFKDPEELNFKSKKFNSRKLLAFMLFLSSISLNAFLINRVFYLANRVETISNNQCIYIYPWPTTPPIIPYQVP